MSIPKFTRENSFSVAVWLLKVVIIWRLALLLLAWLGFRFLPLREDFLGGGSPEYLKAPWLWSWANFDGVHYLVIARQGYCQFQQAFFPLFPYLIRYLTGFLGNYLASGLLVSHLALLAGLFIFYRLVRLDFSDSIARRSVIYLLIFPTSFYLGSVYTESLFLVLVLGSIFAARKRNKKKKKRKA